MHKLAKNSQIIRVHGSYGLCSLRSKFNTMKPPVRDGVTQAGVSNMVINFLCQPRLSASGEVGVNTKKYYRSLPATSIT